MAPDQFFVVPPDSAGARAAMSSYFAELDHRFPEGFDATAALDEAVDAFRPPAGLFVVAGDPTSPSACGGIAFLDADRAEVRRMWVAPDSRGHGLASRLLAHLEQLAADEGRTTVLLDTHRVLHEAQALYARNGYTAVARYNTNPYAGHWFAKQLPTS
jgi:GNAT superfamily N-acetyltransferase